MKIRPFAMEDYEAAYALWSNTPGVGLSDADKADSIRLFLARNPGLSFVAVDEDGALAGTVLAGHDGRRGFLYHLAVALSRRSHGTGQRLAQAALDALRQEGIAKVHIMVLGDNAAGQAFWSKLGWMLRDNLIIYSQNICPPAENKSYTC